MAKKQIPHGQKAGVSKKPAYILPLNAVKYGENLHELLNLKCLFYMTGDAANSWAGQQGQGGLPGSAFRRLILGAGNIKFLPKNVSADSQVYKGLYTLEKDTHTVDQRR
jgi:hypothetical protein